MGQGITKKKGNNMSEENKTENEAPSSQEVVEKVVGKMKLELREIL